MFEYATPEWLEAVKKTYNADPGNAMLKRLKKICFCYRIKADPAYGIDPDLYFICGLDDAVLKELRFATPEESKKVAGWVLSAPFQLWKRIIRKEYRFITAVIHGDVPIETGDKAELIGRTSWAADQLVSNFYKTETKFPDEMSPDELTAYKAKVSGFRKKLGV